MIRAHISAAAGTLLSLVGLQSVSAQVYNGGGLQAGVDAAKEVEGVGNVGIREMVGNIVDTVLNYTALVAVIVIIIAGFYLIFSLGDDSRRDTARKIILYVAIGLLVIGLAKVFVRFFLSLPGAVG